MIIEGFQVYNNNYLFFCKFFSTILNSEINFRIAKRNKISRLVEIANLFLFFFFYILSIKI